MVARRSKMKWSEAARLQVIEAVIKVEEKMMSESCKGRGRSPGTRQGKWARGKKSNAVASLLPPQFGERTWNHRKQMYNDPKCCLMFNGLLHAYRNKLGGKVCKIGTRRSLSEPVIELLKSYESLLLNARCSDAVQNSLRSTRPKGINANGEQQLSKNVSNSEEGQSTTSVREEGTARSLQHTHELESAEDVRSLFSNVEREERPHADHDKSTEKDTAGCTPRSRSVDESERQIMSIPTPRSRARTLAQTRRQTREQTRAHIHDSLSAARRPSAEWRASSLKRKGNAWKTANKSYDNEHMQAIMEEPLKRLSVELMRLSAWVLNQEIPIQQSVVNELISAETRSGKIMQKFSGGPSVAGTVSEIFDGLIQKSVNRMIDNQIRDSFDKLGTLFLKELKTASKDLAQKVLEEAHFLTSST